VPETNAVQEEVLCQICDGQGFYVRAVGPDHPDHGQAVMCECREKEVLARQQDRLLIVSQLGALTKHTFDTFKPTGIGLSPTKARNLRMAYESVRAYAEKPEGWLLLKGGYGCGKTHLASAVANFRLESGQHALFVNVPDLLDHLRSTYGPNSEMPYDQRFNSVREAPLLILDDLGSQSNTAWAQEKLFQILNHRYNGELPTVITTNQDLDTIELRMQSRIADSTKTRMVTILAPDYRRAGVAQDQSNLSSLSLHGNQTFETFHLRDSELPRKEAENLQRARDLAKEYAANPEKWLVFNSKSYGCGKTHLAAAIANRISTVGDSVLFVVVPDLLDHLRATYNPTNPMNYDEAFEQVKRASLLVLDDLGTESATPWAREKLYQLFNHRYSAELPTVITTATPVDKMDARLRSRMMDSAKSTFFRIEAPEYQGKRDRSRGFSR